MVRRISCILYFSSVGILFFSFSPIFSPILADVKGILIPLGIALCSIGWLGALITTAQQGQWQWFFLILFLSMLGMLLYAIFGLPDISPPDMSKRGNDQQKDNSIHWSD
ncbi:hypothetical protein EPA93_05005 [Ktedonosporobacter rubrisoli]|uniref:Uncharacterized protein n=1 Tax=Ktedonosporobacter rubrisoli TaxID=2509675 RepID=A0A4P6JJT5_KTERU|nr:hypothetical protein [Ktedonosporobacter rubrisoli]QBD75394.1 hypothetical protein EPA93_05005 [Ktedonosporobacter rubrisoli]